MTSRTYNTLAALLLLAAPTLAVTVSGYLGQACHGENLYKQVTTDGQCYGFSNIQAAGSLVLTDFAPNQTISFYTDGNCQSSEYACETAATCFGTGGHVLSFNSSTTPVSY